MISGIQVCVRASTIEYLPFHIICHQDSKKKLKYLGGLELLNVEGGWMAKDYWAENMTMILLNSANTISM